MKIIFFFTKFNNENYSFKFNTENYFFKFNHEKILSNGLETCNFISLIIRTGFAVIKRFEHEFNTCTEISSNQITVYTGNCLLIGYTFFY